MIERQIAWEKWRDFNDEDSDIDPVDTHEDSDEPDESDEGHFELVPVIVRTPIGNYSPFEPLLPSNMFDCWICHTNFDINESDKAMLDLVEGIEVLKVMTRYRFFIGIGKMFSLTEVRPLVEAALRVNQKSHISAIISEIFGKKRWAVGIYDDGSHISISSESDNDELFDTSLKDLKESGAINIVTSEDV